MPNLWRSLLFSAISLTFPLWVLIYCHAKDVLAIEIADSKKAPRPISAVLRMLRPAVLRTRSHRVLSKFDHRDECVILTQEFSEDDYYCGGKKVRDMRGAILQFDMDKDESIVMIPVGISLEKLKRTVK